MTQPGYTPVSSVTNPRPPGSGAGIVKPGVYRGPYRPPARWKPSGCDLIFWGFCFGLGFWLANVALTCAFGVVTGQ